MPGMWAGIPCQKGLQAYPAGVLLAANALIHPAEAGEDLLLLVHSPQCELGETLDLGIQLRNLIVKANV